MLSRVKLHGSSVGWFWFWAAALIVLPNCTLDRSGIVSPSNVTRGDPPRTSAIFCDIERPLPATTPATARRCATSTDLDEGIRLAEAAVALVAGRTTTIGLDFSPTALANCDGQPEAVEFQGSFPEGSPVCLNCGVIGPAPDPHASNAAVCTALCLDLFAVGDGNVPPSAEATAFCATSARLATNFPATGCFDSACSTMGGVSATFDDPRRHPEPVDWISQIGVTATGGSLTRTAPFTGNFDAGASSSQLIAGGDAYFEFTVTETNTSRIAGLSSGPPPPGGVQFAQIQFAIELFSTGEVFVVENGTATSSFGAYTPGQKYRVKLRDRFDGSADVSYVRITGPCTDGSPCSESELSAGGTTATYPIRVDALFLELGGTLTDARIVRIR